MSSEGSSAKPVMDAARVLADQTYRWAHGASGRSGGGTGPSTIPSRGTVAGEAAAEGADVARQAAGILLRAARAFGEQTVDAAGELESLVTGRKPRDPSQGAPPAPGAAPRRPAALMLGSVSPGRSASKPFDVRNDSLDTINAMPLHCDGLFGAAGRHIAARNVTFDPLSVNVRPQGTAEVKCTVAVPRTATRGTYTGLITASDRTGVQLLVSLTVI
jgi:hypothetical protein